MKIKRILQIILTNWIHLVGFYIMTYLSLILFKLLGLETDDSWLATLLINPFSILILFIVYGIPFIAGFHIAIILMDLILFSWKNKWPKVTLIIEWMLISLPFIYWAFDYEYWLWISLSISFFTTQMIRLKRIKKIEIKQDSAKIKSIEVINP
jgi:hypothetical protein